MDIKRKKTACMLVLAAGIACLAVGCGLRETAGKAGVQISQQREKPNRSAGKEKETSAEKSLPVEEAETLDTQTEEPVQTETDFTEQDIWQEDGEYALCYAYSTLDDPAKQVYREVLETILEQKEKTEVSTLDIDVLEQAYKAVSADHGGLYWVSGYVYTQYTRDGELASMDFSPKYTMEYGEREALQRQIDASVEELLSGVSITDSDYAKAKYVFEILVQNVDYDSSAENNQNIISVFLNRATVCQGYACAAQYLLRLLGIQSTIVTGSANGESHAWNLMRLDGSYYYMDTTWGNSRYLDASSQMEKYVNYNYLAITSEEISRTHTLDSSFPLPECSAMDNNYFVKEGRYFSEWNPDAVGAALEEVWSAGGGDAAVKFSSPELYQKALDYFITEQHITDYNADISSIYYLEDAEMYVVTFHL